MPAAKSFTMPMSIFFLALSLFQTCFSLSATTDTLRQGSSLSVEKPDHDVLVSPNGIFSAGFSSVGDNAFCFAISFIKPPVPTKVWMANRDQPVNGIGSKLSLLRTGNLVLLDAGSIALWSTETASSSVHLRLHNDGNLVLHNTTGDSLWESFNSPTDTLLPGQKLTKDAGLISSKSDTNYSSGYYSLYFDTDNVLRLLLQSPDQQISSIYWPQPWLWPYEIGRSTYNNSKTAMFNSTGYFSSSDDLVFSASDCGVIFHRQLKLDPDGNLRLYSFREDEKTWVVTWQAISEPCRTHGVCGPNSFCTVNHASGRKCSCLQGFKKRNYLDWSYGCEPQFDNSFNNSYEETGFVHIPNSEFYGYDSAFSQNVTLEECEEKCLKSSQCKAMQYKFDWGNSYYNCYIKSVLLNGRHTPNFDGDVYLRLPKSIVDLSNQTIAKDSKPDNDCPDHQSDSVMLDRAYEEDHENKSLKFLLWFATAVGGVETACIAIVLCYLYWNRSQGIDKATRGYMLAATRFQEFSYAELKKATKGFREEIGRGSGGIVYKGILSDNRVAAIKMLKEADEGKAEFLTEVSIIGRLNHMSLIETWGYCTQGKHRLLVYEYMENGSLASKLANSTALDWEKRMRIAVGIAKGLAYLHEECLEWVLHCDVKPQNILLDSDYCAKVADFGLSKLHSTSVPQNSSFSRIRGTRGYMAPEWVYNLPITSKVDVYSYGIVVLEIVTGKKPTGIQISERRGMTDQHGSLVTWVKEKMNGAEMRSESWIKEIADPMLADKFETAKLKLLVKVALQCVEEDKEARPTMSQVVQMLQRHSQEDS